MKLLSIQVLWQGTTKVLLRFPLQFLIAIASTVLFWMLVGMDYQESLLKHHLTTALSICNLALTLLLASDLFCEAHKYSVAKKWAFRVIALSICVGLYFLLDPWAYLADTFRLVLFAFAFHLLVAFAPYIGKKEFNGFWQYNKSLFLRFLVSAFYAGVLYAGLAVALVAIDGLFSVNITSTYYLRLFGFVSAGFTTIFFLAGVPEDFTALAEDRSYPKGLKIFTQYVLIPLMSVYLAILLAYEVKIMISWSLPKGFVSMLVLGYAVFGILSLLLIYPIKDNDGNGWIRLFSKFFYLMMIPLVVLLLLAIGTRIGHYGITESRYILIVLALWLSAITAYFLLSKAQNIKVIPISLCLIALLATYGPQSAFSISKFSQIARMKSLMETKDKKKMEERADVLRYLVDQHGLTSLQQFTKVDLSAIDKKIDQRNQSSYYMRDHKVDTAFAILNIKDTRFGYANEYIHITSTDEKVALIGGYDALIRVDSYNQDSIYTFDGTTVKLKSKQHTLLDVSVGDEQTRFDFRKLSQDVIKKYEAKQLKKAGYNSFYLPSAEMQFTQQLKNYTIKLIILDFNGNYDSDKKYENFNIEGYLLLKKN